MGLAIIGNNTSNAKVKVVTELPTTGSANTIYFVPNNTTGNNAYDEYIWIKDTKHPDGYFEKIGQKDINLELEPYALKDYVDEKLINKADIKDVTNAIGELENKIGKRIEINGNITNNPDEEDITAEGDTIESQVLKLKDRVYDKLNFSGKGYKILRKNIQTIDGVRKNILTNDMINESNTIYEIRYDFDLNSIEITLPENCVLKFNGGSFKNGILVGNNTSLTNFDYKKNTCNYKGNFINTEPIYIENFTELENYNIPIGTKFTLIGENPVIAIRKATSNNNEVLWENNDRQKYLYNSTTLIVDHFGCRPNNKDLIDSNSRIIEKLTQYRLPIKFLSGTYYLRNIDLNLYKQRLFSFVGIEFDAYGLSGIDNINSAIDTDGSDLFLTFTSIESMHSIRLFWLKFKSKDFSGKVINVVSEKVTDISLEAQDCYFQEFDAVIRSKYYGTGLTIKNCTFRNCRTGISFEYACNLAYLYGCNFLNVGQCIRVYGINAMIIKTEINCLYTGDDWETLELYCFYVMYDCKIDQVYFEPYGQHDSIYRFNILITTGSELNKIIANYMQFPRVTAEPNKQITHVKVKSVNPNYPYNYAKLLFVGTGDRATNDISNYPSFIKAEDVKGNELDVFATNILYNGKAITDTKYILSGMGGIPLSLKETDMLTGNKNLEKFELIYPSNSQSVNKYNELIPESLRNNTQYYIDGYFCLMFTNYNLDMTLNITNSPNGLIDIYLCYRTSQAVREYIYLGTCNIINGKAKFRTTLDNIASGGQWFSINIGKQPDNDAYAKINGGTPFECTLKLDMTPV